MSKVSKSNLTAAARKLLFDYKVLNEKMGGGGVRAGGAESTPDQMPLGFFDRHVAELGNEIPLSPAPQSSIQLSTQRPPVEDDEWSPSDSSTLGMAIGVLSDELDMTEIKQIYKYVRERLNSYKRKKQDVFTEGRDDDKFGDSGFYDDDDDEEFDFEEKEMADWKKGSDARALAAVEATPAEKRRQLKFKPKRQEVEPVHQPEIDPDRVPFLQQVMAITGHSGESGARQWTHKKELLMWFLTSLQKDSGYKTILGQFYKDFEQGMISLGNKRKLGQMTPDTFDAFLEDAESVSSLQQPQNEHLGNLYRELLSTMFTSKFLITMIDELKNALEDHITTLPAGQDLDPANREDMKKLVHLAKMAMGEVSPTLKNFAKVGMIDQNELKNAEKLLNHKDPMKQYRGQEILNDLERKLRSTIMPLQKYRKKFIEDNVSNIAFDVYEKQNIKNKMPGELAKMISKVW